MKRALTIGISGVAVAAALSVVPVRARSPEPVAAVEALAAVQALPVSDIIGRVLAAGFDPISRPLRRGPYYVLNAYDPRGTEVRIVADAQLGDILSVARVAPLATVPSYGAGPRIIHVPQPGEEDSASAPNVRQVVPDGDDEIDEPAPPPRRQSVAPPQQRSQKNSAVSPEPRRKPYTVATPVSAPAERRAVLSAPIHDGPTPVRPTPRYAKETGVKFPPPPGYTPPANLPQEPAAEAAPQEPTADAAPQSDAPQTDTSARE